MPPTFAAATTTTSGCGPTGTAPYLRSAQIDLRSAGDDDFAILVAKRRTSAEADHAAMPRDKDAFPFRSKKEETDVMMELQPDEANMLPHFRVNRSHPSARRRGPTPPSGILSWRCRRSLSGERILFMARPSNGIHPGKS